MDATGQECCGGSEKSHFCEKVDLQVGASFLLENWWLWQELFCFFVYFKLEYNVQYYNSEYSTDYTGCPKKKDTVTLSHNFRLNYSNSKCQAVM